jgi:hypothetical protein
LTPTVFSKNGLIIENKLEVKKWTFLYLTRMEGEMEVSETDLDLGGHDLIETLVCLTGLPEGMARKELDTILEQSGNNSQHLTLQQLREALVTYLETLQPDFLDESTTILE